MSLVLGQTHSPLNRSFKPLRNHRRRTTNPSNRGSGPQRRTFFAERWHRERLFRSPITLSFERNSRMGACPISVMFADVHAVDTKCAERPCPEPAHLQYPAYRSRDSLADSTHNYEN